MPYTIAHRDQQPPHEWTLVSATCVLDAEDDALVLHTTDLLRRCYGEHNLVSLANEVVSQGLLTTVYNTDHLVAAIRRGLPNPDAEGNRPAALRPSRSQVAEIVGRATLELAYGVSFPVAPQAGSKNANQPILGFDAWGVWRAASGDWHLVVVQVKATDDPECPPQQSRILADECARVPKDVDQLCRDVCAFITMLSSDSTIQAALLTMLETLGRGQLPHMLVAPVVVRGLAQGSLQDIQPCRDRVADFQPAAARGIVVTLGVSLDQFGRIVTARARGVA